MSEVLSDGLNAALAAKPGPDPFRAVLAEMEALHGRKAADYGAAHLRDSSIKSSEAFGIPSWIGVLLRANDKMRRLQQAARTGTLSNEGVEDSLIDLANYAVLALIEYRESRTEAS